MKICIIGCEGHSAQAAAEMKRHPEAAFVGIAPGGPLDRAERIAMLGREFGIPVFDSYVKMLDRTSPDVAVVSPVFGQTAEISMECARRGIDVFSEKPVAGTLEELEALRRAVADHGIRFSAMHFLRFSPGFYAARKAVRDGAVGEVKLLNARKSYKFGVRPAWYADRRTYTGTIPWVGIHAIDWIYAFSGADFRAVSAFQEGCPERSCAMIYRMENGIIAAASLDFYRPDGAPTHGDDFVRVVGTAGVLEARESGYILTGAEGVKEFACPEGPALALDFLYGRAEITAGEAFRLTEVALRTRDAADRGEPAAL